MAKTQQYMFDKLDDRAEYLSDIAMAVDAARIDQVITEVTNMVDKVVTNSTNSVDAANHELLIQSDGWESDGERARR